MDADGRRGTLIKGKLVAVRDPLIAGFADRYPEVTVR